MKRAERCKDWWERRTRGRRYVNARGQCKRLTAHPSGYCKTHRYGYRWTDQQEFEWKMQQATERQARYLARKRKPLNPRDVAILGGDPSL